ncbi:hypothetical protein [Aetokthonos hydrillicola]|uniref:hypothetical protein n=1 Tax=Aetokthonos hydrillicola TaxID=1550245 RepID=UPI001FB91DEF
MIANIGGENSAAIVVDRIAIGRSTRIAPGAAIASFISESSCSDRWSTRLDA